MKKGNLIFFVLRLGLTLLLITSVMAAALAVVNAITAPKIAALREEKIQKAIAEVLPGGGSLLDAGSYTDETGLVTRVFASDKGYAVEVAPIGFDNAITMMVGVDKNGTVSGVSIISHTETAGLGAVAAADSAAGQAFRDQFIGANGSVAVSKDGGTIDALTGATVTSRAICTGINAALACVAGMQ